MNNITGWKAVVFAVVITSMVTLRVVLRMNRWRNDSAPANVAAPADVSASAGGQAPQPVEPLQRGDDFTLEKLAKIPTAKGYVWKKELEAKDHNGAPVYAYTAKKPDSPSFVSLQVLKAPILDDSARLLLFDSLREKLLKLLKAEGVKDISLQAPSPEKPFPNYATFSFTGTQPNGTPVEVRGAVLFRVNTYLYSCLAENAEQAETLLSYATQIKELGPGSRVHPDNFTIVDASKLPPPMTFREPSAPAPADSVASPAQGNDTAGSQSPSVSSEKPEEELPPGDYKVIKLPVPAFDSTIAADGRVLALHLNSEEKVALLDLRRREIIGTIPASQDALIAGGKEHLVVVDPATKEIARWSLATQQLEKSGRLELDGYPQSIALGYGSLGPVLIHWVIPDRRFGHFTFVDLETFELRQITPMDRVVKPGLVHISNAGKADVELRASADSRVFMIRPGSGSSSFERLFAGRVPVVASETTGSGGHAIPSADGRIFCTSNGFFSPSLVPLSPDQIACFPTCDPKYFLSLSETELMVRHVITGKTLKVLSPPSELGKDFLKACRFGCRKSRYQLMEDQRIHCVPAENLIATIPPGEDRVLVHEIPFDSIDESNAEADSKLLVMPGMISSAIPAGSGRFLVVHAPEQEVAVVVELSERRIVGTVPAPQDVLIAAGREKVIVVQPSTKQVTRFSLATLEREGTGDLAIEGIPRAIAMGHASTGPVVMHWTNDRGGTFSLMDSESFKLQQLCPLPYQQIKPGEVHIGNTGKEWGGVEIRMTPDGKSFGLWENYGGGRDEVVTLSNPPKARFLDGARGHIVPTAFGSVLTGNGTFRPGVPTVVNAQHVYLPTTDDRFVLCLSDKLRELQLVKSGKSIATLPELPDMDAGFLRKCYFGQKKRLFELMHDQRVHCLPSDNLLVVIPPTVDRLVFQEVSFNVTGVSSEDAEASEADTVQNTEPTKPSVNSAGKQNGIPNESLSAESGPPKMRMWTDKTGKFRVLAKMISSDGTIVVLEKSDGTTSNVPLSRLSEADAAYVKKMAD